MMTTEQREAVRARLEQIAAKHGGVLRPDDVVVDARAKDSPLHAYFEWDVKKAAAKHWIDQARNLIVSVRVIITTETTRVSSVFYARDPRAPADEQGYVSVTKLRTDADMAREVLLDEFARVAAALRRAKELAAALNAEQEVDDLLQSAVGLQQRIAEMPAATQ
jgi:hypothetical protein